MSWSEIRKKILNGRFEVDVRATTAQKFKKMIAKNAVVARHLCPPITWDAQEGLIATLSRNLHFDRNRLSPISEDVSHAPDLSPNAAQLFFDVLITAVHVVDAVENRFAIGDKRSQHQRSRSPQIGAHHGRRRERRLAAHRS